MKKLIRVICIVLVVVIIIAGSFWAYNRIVYQRSFMAGLVDVVLVVTHRSDKFNDVEVCEEFMAEKAVENQAPFEMSDNKFGISVREETFGALQAYIYNDQDAPAQTVFYFHGGAFVNQPNNQQLTMAARTPSETGCELVLMVYPKAPVYTCDEAYELCSAYIEQYVAENDCGKIVFMGDSAGGGLALGMAEYLKLCGTVAPEELILISPWAELTMENPELENAMKTDVMLGVDGLRRIAEYWAGELALTDYRVSPLYGDMSGLCPVTMFASETEGLYPDIIRLQDEMLEQGVECTLTVRKNMAHCWPICPIPEADEARIIIWDTITRK